MKKVALIFALVFMAFVNANEITNNNTITKNREASRYRYNQPLKFIERGVEFFVFPNGEFDFNTHPRYHRSNYRRSNTHVSINTTYGAPRAYHSQNHRSGVRVEHDHLGRVRRIGSVFINYDHNGRIKRVGSVYMNYHHRLLTNIGGLHIFYNRHHQIIRTTGRIKHNIGCHFCGTFNCTTNHYDNHHNGGNHYDNDWDNDWDDGSNHGNDDDMYYYRKDKKSKKGKKD